MRRLALALTLACAACSSDPASPRTDDATAPDAASDDVAGADADGPDAGAPDADGPDAGAPDADGPDAGAPDTTPDSQAPDTTPDAESSDATTTDAASGDLPESDACAPVCAERNACGDDGCGGSCGSCVAPLSLCFLGTCVDPEACVPDCFGKQCGDDGCGGSCGVCTDPDRRFCGLDGQCGGACVPDCVDRVCGSDGCGGACGTCGAGDACSAEGLCVDARWTCATTSFGAEDQCDCGCGAPDPDCARPWLSTSGCDHDAICVAGACTPRVPASWSCDPGLYDNGGLCDCGCGLRDPDCDAPAALLGGCGPGEVCDAAGACAACVPSCDGRACGSDGCGGTCGGCGDGLACVAGRCVAGCDPTPVVCATATCGDDGCGGTCGTCAAGEACVEGACVPEPGRSCLGFCKGEAPAGCSCEADCAQGGDCCPDYDDVCVCKPSCDGKVCGPDGCGGVCGSCRGSTPWCKSDGTACAAVCEPRCDGRSCGPDGCGGSCGTCGGGSTCNFAGVCVPPDWYCPDFDYADGSACDCGCGAPDPDCGSLALTFGCPWGAACVDATGLCEVTYCSHRGDCTAPRWCVGHWPSGAGRRQGVCQAPNPSAAPAGEACVVDLDCATGLCALGRCREPCRSDAHCGGGACVGFPVIQSLTLQPMGVVGACDGTATLGDGCSSQAACGPTRDCLAVIDPVTLAPAHRCGRLPAASLEGAPCEGTTSCALGLVCASGRCALPCPAGQADCPGDSVCLPTLLHGGASAARADDVFVHACKGP